MRKGEFNPVLFGVMFGLLSAIFRTDAPQQPRPDFSGRWTIAPAAAATPAPGAPAAAPPRPRPGDVGPGWGSTLTIAQTPAALTVEYAFFTRGDMQPPIRFTFALDGSESKNTVMMGRGFQVERSKTSWDGPTLVITTLHDYRGADGKPATFEVTRRLTLEAPDTLIVETSHGGAAAIRTTYRK